MSEQGIQEHLPQPVADPHYPAKDGSKRTIRKPLRMALEKMVNEGLKRAEAAKAVGMTDHSLREALRRPHVQAYRRALMDELRTSEGHRSYLKLTELREKAASEHVQMESAKFVAGVSGISPVQKQEVTHSGQVQVGYVIDLSPPMKDVTPKDGQLIDNQGPDDE